MTQESDTEGDFIFSEDEQKLLSCIRDVGPTSRSELSRLTDYSRGKVRSIIKGLIDKGVLEEVGVGKSYGGRRPNIIDLRRDYCYVAGIDIGATSIDAAIADFSGKFIERSSEAADVTEGPLVVLGRVKELISEMLQINGLKYTDLRAIGIGVPGPVQYSTGLLIAPPIMPGWEAFPIREYMLESFPLASVVVDNDVNIMALGELRAGAGKDIKNFIYVKIGTGIGAGIVANGEMYRGSTGCAGDIGHICVDRDGPICRCGNVGCLEAIAGGPSIASIAMNAIENSESPVLLDRLESGCQPLTAEDVGAAAAAGDPISMGIIIETGRIIGEVLAGLVNFFNPSLILIGGGVSNIGHQLLSSIRRAVLTRSLPLSTRDLRIEYSFLGKDAGTTGATCLALEQIIYTKQL